MMVVARSARLPGRPLGLPGLLRRRVRLPDRADPRPGAAQLQRRALLHLHRGHAALRPGGVLSRWYRSIFDGDEWTRPLANSLVIGISATVVATVLGAAAALGLAHPAMPGRKIVTALLISPMITPVIIAGVGMFFFYSNLGLAQTHIGIILAHAVFGAPFVVITVSATLAGFDWTVMRAAANLAPTPSSPSAACNCRSSCPASSRVPVRLRRVLRRTRHRPVHGRSGTAHPAAPDVSGIREEISPTILAVATFLIVFALLALSTVEWLRRRGAAGGQRAG